MRRKFLSLLLAAAMCISLLPTAALAAGGATAITVSGCTDDTSKNRDYSSLTEALNAAAGDTSESATVKLNGELYTDADLSLPAGTYILDLNGYALNVKIHYSGISQNLTVPSGANVTITNSSTSAATLIFGTLSVNAGGSLTIKKSEPGGWTTIDGTTIESSGTLTINGCILKSSIAVNGGLVTVPSSTTLAGNVTVSGGTFSMESGSFSGASLHTLTVTGGTATINSNNYQGCAITVSNGTLNLKLGAFSGSLGVSGGTVNISGGSFGTGGNSFAITATGGDVNITGGTFGSGSSLNVTGGTVNNTIGATLPGAPITNVTTDATGATGKKYGDPVSLTVTPTVASPEATPVITYKWYEGTNTLTSTDTTWSNNPPPSSVCTPASLSVGSHAINCDVTVNGYTVTVPFNFNVGKAELSATVSMSGYTYGDETLPTPSVSGAPTGASVTCYYATSYGDTSGNHEWTGMTGTTLNAGTYYIYAVIGETDNYEGGTVWSSAFTVAKKSATLKAKDKTLYVGDPAPTPTGTAPVEAFEVTGTVGTDTLPQPSLNYEPTPDMTRPGTSAIKPTGDSEDGNYTITYVNGTLHILARPSSGDDEPTYYPITVAESENGSAEADRRSAPSGRTVTVTVDPDSGYTLQSLTVTTRAGKSVTVTEKNGKYTFAMPAAAVTVTPVFQDRFNDVPKDDWYTDAVDWADDNGITNGTGDGGFDPNGICSRAQFVTFLWRSVGSPTVDDSIPFPDVEEDAWYAEAVRWATSVVVVKGYDTGIFGTADDITREQAVTMLYRFARLRGMDVSVGEDTNILSYSDAGDISGYAFEALQWACGAGIVQGNNGQLMPGKTCTRAELVTMLYRIVNQG